MRTWFPILLAAGCAATPAAPPSAGSTPPSPTASASASAPASASTSEPASASASASASAPDPAPATHPEVAVRPFERIHEGKATSLALGKRGYGAILVDGVPWRYDGKAWKEEPLPDALAKPAGASDDVAIFFGRDNRMRLMGARRTGDEVGLVYLRYKHGWREGHREIGSLANKPHNGLFGILGWDDPEVVCRIGGKCIIKRLTGWTVIDAGPGAPDVVIAQERAWALHDDHIAEVTNKGWKSLDAIPFRGPRGLWADADGNLWVSAGAGMYHHDGKGWTKHHAPVKRPRAVWGSGPNDVWVVGDDGAGQFDGKAWRKVKGPRGPLAHVLGRDGAVWLAGASGTWRSAPR